MLQTWGHVSEDPSDTQYRVGTVLRRHQLRLEGPEAGFCARLEHLGDADLSITRLGYGAAVCVEPVPEPGFWVLSLPLQGEVHVDADSGRAHTHAGVASFIPSHGQVHGHWLQGSRQAVLRVRAQLLEEACAAFTDDAPRFLHGGSPALPVDTDTGLLRGLLHTLAALDFRAHAALPSSVAAAQWSALAQSLASAVACARAGAAPRRGPAVTTAQQRLRRARALMRELVEAEEPASVPIVAARLGMSVRSLQVLFQSQAGTTALQALRELRLQRARGLLAAGRGGVADVALACGFHHQGRFAALYAQRFGCLPSRERRG